MNRHRRPVYFRPKSSAPEVTASNMVSLCHVVTDLYINTQLLKRPNLTYWSDPFGVRPPVPEVYWYPVKSVLLIEEKILNSVEYLQWGSEIKEQLIARKVLYQDYIKSKQQKQTEINSRRMLYISMARVFHDEVPEDILLVPEDKD
jgi:hypothetical protein